MLVKNIVNELDIKIKNRHINVKRRSLENLNKMLQSASDVNARKVLSTIISSVQSEIIRIESNDTYIFRVIDSAYLPSQPTFPNKLNFILFGLVLGLTLSFGYIFRKQFLTQ